MLDIVLSTLPGTAVSELEKVLIQAGLGDRGGGVVVRTQAELKPPFVRCRDLHVDAFKSRYTA